MSVKLFHIVLSALFLVVQTHEMKASDNSLQEEQEKSRSSQSPSTGKSKLSTTAKELPSIMTTSTKTRRNKTSSAATSSPSSQTAEASVDALLKGASLPKKENFVIPDELNIYETLMILFAGQKDGKNNKIYFVSKGMAASFDSLSTGTTVEFEAFLHAAKVKGNESFIYLKDLFLIKNPKDKKVITRAEEIFKGKESQSKDLDKALTDIERSIKTLGYFFTDKEPGDYKGTNLHSITARQEHSEKRPHATIADHNSFQVTYYLYVNDIKTKFSFLLNLYRRKVE